MVGAGNAGEAEALEAFMQEGVTTATRTRHKLRFSSWERFLHDRNVGDDLLLALCSKEEAIRMLCLFLYTMKKLWKFSATRISECLRAVTFAMKTAGKDVSWMEGSTVALARSACKEGENGRGRNMAKEGRRRVPFTCDMYLWIRKEFWVEGEWGRREDVDSSMTALGVGLALNFMWRASEYIDSLGHAVQSEDVEVVMRNGVRLFSWQLKEYELEWVQRNVELCLIVVRSSKTDTSGRGRYLVLQGLGQHLRQLLSDLVTWCVGSGVREKEPLLSRWWAGRQKRLTSRMITDALQRAGSAFGFPDSIRFVPHCLRIGGASTMERKEGKSRGLEVGQGDQTEIWGTCGTLGEIVGCYQLWTRTWREGEYWTPGE
jgi:hypothetical protein